METFFLSLIISFLIAFGISIVLTRKGNEYPVKRYRVILQQWIHDNISWKFAQVLYCPVCSIFWLMFFTDMVVFFTTGFSYFFWPFSGFISVGITWIIIEVIKGLDKEPIQLSFNKEEE